MEQEYAVLWKASTSRTTANWMANNLGAEPSSDGDSQLNRVRLEPGAAIELASQSGVDALSIGFRTRLIEPLVEDQNCSEPEWGIKAVGADLSQYSGRGVVVAVLDTGIDDTHPAFAGVSVEKQNFSTSVDDDVNGHGTHCAGTIFGRSVNGTRIGIAPGVTKALIGKVLGDDGGNSLWIFDAINWAMRSGAKIISMSVGMDFPGEVRKKVDAGWPADLAASEALDAYRQNLIMFDALTREAHALAPFGRAPLLIGAAGNGSRRRTDPRFRISTSLPARALDLSVAAVGNGATGYEVAPFSNGGASIAAPGVGIISAKTGGGLRSLSGTSMACPHAAGVAALWFEAEEKSGNGTADGVRSQMLARASRDRFAPSYDRLDHGAGLVVAP